MPRDRKTKIVDGYTVFQAARRVSPESDDAPPAGKSAAPSPPEEGRRIGSHIGRTVLPTRHDITCYECGYTFQMTGKVSSTYCPKCRVQLTVEDVTLSGPVEADVKTGGTVRVTADAVVRSGTVIAGDIVFQGRLAGGRLQAFRWLEIGPGAIFSAEAMASRHLRVAADAVVELPEARFEEVEIYGCLRSTVQATGRVRVKAGGVLEGWIQGIHLEVEDGAGLRAQVAVCPRPEEDRGRAEKEDS